MNTFEEFTDLYPISKTLCFKLIPVGKTLEHIKSGHILKDDLHRSQSYAAVKKIIDEYHRSYIETILSDVHLKTESDEKKDSLEEYLVCYNIKKKSDEEKETMVSIQNSLRKQISDFLSQSTIFQHIDKKELIQKDLLQFIKNDSDYEEKKALIEEFRKFTTYFSEFNENRKKIYSAEEKSTTIAYRLIHENLPKFIDNIKTFRLLLQKGFSGYLEKLYKDFKPILKVQDINSMFRLDYFNSVMTQNQIEIYNAVIGGKDEADQAINGLNDYIILYNRKHKKEKLPKLKLLYKQILSDRVHLSWLPQKFESDAETLQAIKDYYRYFSKNILDEPSLKTLLLSIGEYNLEGIYIRNNAQLSEISRYFSNDSNLISDSIKKQIALQTAIFKDEADFTEKIEKQFKSTESFSIDFINRSLQENGKPDADIAVCFRMPVKPSEQKDPQSDCFTRITEAWKESEELFNKPYPVNKNLHQDKTNIHKIKRLLDAIRDLYHFIRPLYGKGNEADKDEHFYGEFTEFYNILEQITPLYSTVRKYFTQKPFSVDKLKLNFDNSTLLNGWDLNKEKDNSAVILRKEGLYYLGIMNKNSNTVFENYPYNPGKDYYEKMEYKLLPGANKMLPKVFFSKSHITEFNPSEEILENYQNGTHKKGSTFHLEDCHKLIDFFKSSIKKHNAWKIFDFEFSDTSRYSDLGGFYKEVEEQGYKITFRNIASDYIESLVEHGQLYLFEIYSKDFSSFSNGTPNLHTLYWKMLFEPVNLKNTVYKLNGQAEIFFRASSISDAAPSHPAEIPIRNKNRYNLKKESIFPYDLIKNRRYTEDSFLFHVPITMNFKNKGIENINQMVNGYIQKNDDLHAIGITRGEHHLLYLVIIDQNGKIKEQFPLDKITSHYQGKKYKTDYQALLGMREKKVIKANRSWQSIENIKELKEGYLSQVVHKICKLIIKYKAIVVFEDLNFTPNSNHLRMGKQIYLKFEMMLIEKLNYLVDKNSDPEENGGLLKAYQLTNKFDSYQKMGKQCGFIFFMNTWNTRPIDPITGFVNLIDWRYENIEKSRYFFSRFNSILYNTQKDWFEFSLDYNKFNTTANGGRNQWTVCTQGSRIVSGRRKNKGGKTDGDTEIDLTERFKELFKEYNIDYHNSLQESICRQTQKTFYENLLHLMKLTVQINNSSKSGIDYCISPIADENGNFYDSRKSDPSLPAGTDANRTYNLARKGMWIAKRIKDTKDLKNLKLAITNKEWSDFTQHIQK